LPPRADLMPRALRTLAIDAKLVVPAAWFARITGTTVWANSSAAVTWIARPREPARLRFRGLPSLIPLAFFADRAAFVRSEISERAKEARKEADRLAGRPGQGPTFPNRAQTHCAPGAAVPLERSLQR
jgi:hypothetical protein